MFFATVALVVVLTYAGAAVVFTTAVAFAVTFGVGGRTLSQRVWLAKGIVTFALVAFVATAGVAGADGAEAAGLVAFTAGDAAGGALVYCIA